MGNFCDCLCGSSQDTSEDDESNSSIKRRFVPLRDSEFRILRRSISQEPYRTPKKYNRRLKGQRIPRLWKNSSSARSNVELSPISLDLPRKSFLRLNYPTNSYSNEISTLSKDDTSFPLATGLRPKSESSFKMIKSESFKVSKRLNSLESLSQTNKKSIPKIRMLQLTNYDDFFDEQTQKAEINFAVPGNIKMQFDQLNTTINTENLKECKPEKLKKIKSSIILAPNILEPKSKTEKTKRKLSPKSNTSQLDLKKETKSMANKIDAIMIKKLSNKNVQQTLNSKKSLPEKEKILLPIVLKSAKKFSLPRTKTQDNAITKSKAKQVIKSNIVDIVKSKASKTIILKPYISQGAKTLVTLSRKITTQSPNMLKKSLLLDENNFALKSKEVSKSFVSTSTEEAEESSNKRVKSRIVAAVSIRRVDSKPKMARKSKTTSKSSSYGRTRQPHSR